MAVREFTHIIHINASVERVWQILSDLERWPLWTPTVLSVQRLDDRAQIIGRRYRLQQPRLGKATWIITDWIRQIGFVWVCQRPGLLVVAEHKLRPEGTGCAVQLQLKLSGLLEPLVTRYAAGLIDDYLRLEATGLMGRCEHVDGIDAVR